MVGLRVWLLVGGLLALSAAVLVAAVTGHLGPLVVCGADGWAVCVAWPAAISALTWLAFLAFIGALVAWHLREWRRDEH